MSRDDRQPLDDIVDACAAIRDHLAHGGLDNGLVFDAVCMRLLQIGEAAKSIDPSVLESEPAIPWRQITGMRDHLAHRYFYTVHSVVEQTTAGDLDELEAAVRRMIGRLA